jgi:glucose-1-phosphate cytidylyltransferase
MHHKNIKVVLLAGGLGTRLSELTKTIPKPMVLINGKPLIVRIMSHFAKYGFKNFYIATGYKSKIIKKYFEKKNKKWNVKLINTGKNTMTGGRLKRLKKYIGNETFFLTYGDGLSNVNLKKLINFHNRKKNLVTVTAVRPPARFGYMKIKGDMVKYFKEKSRSDEGWINGGYFVVEPSFLKFIKNDKTYLEREPLEIITKKKKLGAYKHRDFWQCVDTLRDVKNLEINLKNIKYKNLFD